ncbi:ParM/StbA family protein [Clostridium estertheticum]|uniref:ParM/StbA family protein n=1 Tax=Clostridium estertheticum TaxID=238834 RepID=UPI001C0DE7DF|nr:ParM/StbA family protein [Clostridium estertheticum]MBU3173270.1 ParM/StbA family protein [Clostridium estertheticum]
MEEKKIIEIKVEVGDDNGNSEHDIVINGESIEQPNVIAKIRKLPMFDEVNIDFVCENIHDNLISTVSSIAASPGIYYSGKYALKSGETIRNIEVGADNNKLNSDVIIINTLEQIAGFAVNYAYEKGEDLNSIEINVKADMTTALPVTQYTKKNAGLFTKKFMDSKHKVTVHVGPINVDVSINFEFVKVLPESVPTTFKLQSMVLIKKEKLNEIEIKHNQEVEEVFEELNKKGETTIDGEFFKGKKILHCGIGEGTTEYPCTNDISFDPNFIKGSNNGIGHAIDKALPEFQEDWGMLNYSRQKYSEVIRDLGHKFNESAVEIVDQYIEEQAEEILHHVKSEIQRANNEVDILAVYGGGSILMEKHLKEKLEDVCKKAKIVLFYVPAKYAVTLESKGMYQFTKGDIFKLLKEKYIKENIQVKAEKVVVK